MYPRTSYIIYAAPRSGSYLLCEALTNTGLAGRPAEFFTPQQVLSFAEIWKVHWSDSAGYLNHVYKSGTTPNGVFGVKIIWDFFEDSIDHLRDIDGNEKLSVPDLLSKTFPRHQAIMIIRRDKVRQALSYWKARQTGAWVSFEEDGSNATPEPVFNFQAIEYIRQNLEEGEREMQRFFAEHHIQPLVVVYEDFVKTYEETILKILDYLRIPIPKNAMYGPGKMQKQANAQTEEWLQRYYNIKQRNQYGDSRLPV